MRQAAVTKLRENGFKVKVIAPNYNTTKIIDTENYTLIPFKENKKALIFQHLGIYNDYLDKWVDKSFDFFKKKIQKNDVIFSSSGDEFGTIILGYKLKNIIGCKYIINLRDPLYKSKIYNRKLSKKKFDIPHKSREKLEEKILTSADVIITSSSKYRDALIKKYPKHNIINNNFGYIKDFKLNPKINTPKKKFEIVYGGNMGSTQSPEILALAVKDMSNVKATFIGNYKENHILCSLKDHVNLLNKMKHEDYMEYLYLNADAGFLSLNNDLSEYCVPSKLYEYINFELPIIGYIKGQAEEIINENQFGFVANNIDELKKNIKKIIDKKNIVLIKSNLKREKPNWSMDKKLAEIIVYL